MATRSRRLGKGLGALFPTLPGEAEEATDNSTEQGSDASRTEAPSRPVKEAAASDRQKSAASRSQSTTKKPVADAGSSEGKRTKSASSKKGKRPSMPSLTESLHPSDMFFGGEDHGTAGKSHLAVTSATDFIVSTVPKDSSVAESADSRESSSPETAKPVAGGYLAELSVTDIVPNDHQPRQIFDEDELIELSRSIQEVGVLQPIVVRKRPQVASDSSKHAKYELIMGERRWRATQLAKLTMIPAIVKTTADDDMLRDALLENLHRVALNPLEEAAAYQQMLNEFGLTQEQLSKSVSKSRPQIANTLRLLQLPAAVQKKVSSGVLSAGHARALLSLSDPEQMETLANKIIAEGLSVRSTEEIVALQTAKHADKKKRVRKPSIWADSPTLHSLENRFDTKVAIKGTAKRGRIEISFASEEDFNRIVQLLGESSSTDDKKSDGWV